MIFITHLKFDLLYLSSRLSYLLIRKITGGAHQLQIGTSLFLQSSFLLHLTGYLRDPQRPPRIIDDRVWLPNINSIVPLLCTCTKEHKKYTCASASCRQRGACVGSCISSCTFESHVWHCCNVSRRLTCFCNSWSRIWYTCTNRRILASRNNHTARSGHNKLVKI